MTVDGNGKLICTIDELISLRKLLNAHGVQIRKTVYHGDVQLAECELQNVWQSSSQFAGLKDHGARSEYVASEINGGFWERT